MGKKLQLIIEKQWILLDHELQSMKGNRLGLREKVLVDKSGQGNDFLGWIDLPVAYDKVEFARIKESAAKIQSDSDVLLVIGIGGSYLGRERRLNFKTWFL